MQILQKWKLNINNLFFYCFQMCFTMETFPLQAYFLLYSLIFQMKLALLGLFALLDSATALKIHKVSHRQDVTETPPTADAETKVLAKFDKDGDGLGQKQFKKFVKKGGGSVSDAQQAFKKLDADGNGIISNQEFAKLEQVAAQQQAELSPIQSNPGQVPAA